MIVRSSRVVLPDGVRPAAIHIADGRIVSVGPAKPDLPDGAPLNDVGNLVVLPGLVDTHVHVNEPGRTDWEGFETATRAAAAGGVATLVDMPLNSVPPTTSVAALEAKRARAVRRAHVDVGFWGGVVPGNGGELDSLVDAGVRGFKCFLVPSGVDEFPAVGEDDLRAAMPVLARRGVPLLVHAEDPAVLSAYALRGNGPAYQSYLATRPPSAEVAAITLIVRLAREFGTPVHIVHVASREAADAIARAKRDGVPITAETCPHYLTFAAEAIPDGATEYKCAPPIRDACHRDALWMALRLGTLDMIASDHSPAPVAMKPPGDFQRAWGGISSLELALAAVWTGLSERSNEPSNGAAHAAHASHLQMVARWMSEEPARLAGLLGRKGRIAAGYDADLAIWDPDTETTVDPMRLQQRHKVTPYAGRQLRGRVCATFVRGHSVWRDGALAGAACGQLL